MYVLLVLKYVTQLIIISTIAAWIAASVVLSPYPTDGIPCQNTPIREWCQLCLILFITLSFLLSPNFTPSPWRPPDVVTAKICRYNPAYNNPVETPFTLLWSRIRYDGQKSSLSEYPLWDMETEPLKPLFPLL